MPGDSAERRRANSAERKRANSAERRRANSAERKRGPATNQGGAKSQEKHVSSTDQASLVAPHTTACRQRRNSMSSSGFSNANHSQFFMNMVLDKQAICYGRNKIEDIYSMYGNIADSFGFSKYSTAHLNSNNENISPEDYVFDDENMSLQHIKPLSSLTFKTYELIAVIATFKKDTSLVGHVVAYIRINNKWYIADNEKGVIQRRSAGIPSKSMKYMRFNGKENDSLSMIGAMTIYWDPAKLPAVSRTNIDYAGVPTFGQTGGSCALDSLQSVLMFADGPRDLFRNIYSKLDMSKCLWPTTRPSQTKMTNNWKKADVCIADYKEQIKKYMIEDTFIKIRKKRGGEREYDDNLTNAFIALMFIRFYRISNTPRELLNSINLHDNISGGPSPEIPPYKGWKSVGTWTWG